MTRFNLPVRRPRFRGGLALALCTTVAAALLGLSVPIASAQSDSASDAAPDRIPLPTEDRDPVAETLQATLVELAALQHDAHQAHWNVRGPEFYQLHEFFAELYEAVSPLIDDVAERQLAVGQNPDARPRTVADTAGLGTFPAGPLPGDAALAAVHRPWAEAADRVRQRIDDLADLDAVSQDLLIDVSATLEKYLWQLRAHLDISDDKKAEDPQPDRSAIDAMKDAS